MNYCKVCGYPAEADYCSPVHKVMGEATWIEPEKRADKIQSFAEQTLLKMNGGESTLNAKEY